MENRKEVEREILIAYSGLRKEKDNYGGHYEGNPYNGINIFGTSVSFSVPNAHEVLANNDVPEFVKQGVGISVLCKLAEAHSEALDEDIDPISYVMKKYPDILKQLNERKFDKVPNIKKSIETAYRDSIEFSRSLLNILDDTVFKYLNA